MKIDKIPDDAVLIPGTIDNYADPRGNVYGYDHRPGHHRHPYIKEKQEVYGYYYVPINYITGRKSRRLHRVIAETFLPNPDNLPIVMHKDNNKKNNALSNLQWGTVSENTKQAFADGLAANAKGIEDSQSFPCDMYETATNRLLASFGSAHEAAKQTGIEVSTICRQINDTQMPVRKNVYFTKLNEGPRDHVVIGKFDFMTDALIETYANCRRAAEANGLTDKGINTQLNKKRKPNWTHCDYYFKRVYLKGEEVIEIKNESRVESV